MGPQKPPTPKSPKTWDIWQHLTKGAATADELYNAVAKAHGSFMTAWGQEQ
jgi:hypothetical protein